MILSNFSIQSALDSGALLLDPEPSPRTLEAGVDCPYQTSSVDLRLGNEIAAFNSGMPIALDLTRGDFNSIFATNSTTVQITDTAPYLLKPNSFVIASTLERVGLPLQPIEKVSLAARVEGKSSYARCGLLVHFTAPTIHAGFEGKITLELINLGPYEITLRPSMPICQLIVEEVHGTPFDNASQFQGQSRPGGG